MAKEKTKSLMSLQKEEHELISKLYDQLGVFDVEDEKSARRLKIEIHSKINTYAMMIKNKSIEFEISKLQAQIDLRNGIIKSWENFRKFAITQLNRFANKSKDNYFPIIDAPYNSEAQELYMYADEGVTDSVDVTKVEEKHCKFQIPKLDHHDYTFLRNQLRKTKTGKVILININENVKLSANVSNLPEKHKAIIKTRTPKVKFLKKIRKNDK